MRRTYRDYGIRQKGSPEVATDPQVLMEMLSSKMEREAQTSERRLRSIEVFNFIVKKALEVLPPKQRKIFFSVWVRADGRMSKGVMEFSRRTRQSHNTNYKNYYKAIAGIQSYLKKSGYEDYIVGYLHNGAAEE